MDLKGMAVAVFKGIRDSLRGTITLFYMDKEMNERMLNRLSPTKSESVKSGRESATPTKNFSKFEESKVLKRTIQCCALNGGVFLLSILLFEWGLLPSLNFVLQKIFGKDSFMGNLVWSWMEPILSFTFKTFWVVPLFLLSKVVNSLWFQDIADSAYKYSRRRHQFMQSISKLLADSIFSIIVQTLFLIQTMLVNFIPIYMVGYGLYLIHMSLLYSLYSFEYKWFNMGWELHKRLAYIETNWPYFIGFGLPLAILTQISDSWFISGCIFSILFPLFIISGNEAGPVTGVCDYPLHLFSPVIALSDMMFNSTIGIKPTTVRVTETSKR
ncbi:etoposide-induced protein 2.4 homolog isoform X2 [Agrilus planipennis]|uniref:Etoposide-induced protein 2.4 homolog isoform X2 n=1 Tax=Agrilus planipennis TaxID=224129 RepID=A0A1W4X4T6_AGRPL|nr:etoposide-induced protein 2.4 homolog isoform X2 [Agrilus planipennis]